MVSSEPPSALPRSLPAFFACLGVVRSELGRLVRFSLYPFANPKYSRSRALGIAAGDRAGDTRRMDSPDEWIDRVVRRGASVPQNGLGPMSLQPLRSSSQETRLQTL